MIVAAGTVAILAVVSGAIAASLGYLRAVEAEQVAQQEAETARRVSDFLVNLFEVSDPSEARGNTITAREVLDRGTDTIDTDLADQPQVQTAMMLTMAKVYENLGLYSEATDILEQARNIRSAAFGGQSPLVADALNQLSEVLVLAGDYAAAETAALEALEIRINAYGDVHADVGVTLSNLATIDYYQSEYDESDLARATDLRHELRR